jgi:hypothetical protein
MEDIVAVRLSRQDGPDVFVLTWGWIQDRIDPSPLEALVIRAAPGFGINASRAKVCETLQEAAGEPYFFEGLFHMSRTPIPFGESYESWRRDVDAAMQDGKRDVLPRGNLNVDHECRVRWGSNSPPEQERAY